MLLFHVFLICTCQTTHEIYYKEKNLAVQLFMDLKKIVYALPFDMGILQNIKGAIQEKNM